MRNDIKKSIEKNETLGCALFWVGILSLITGVILAIIGFNQRTAIIGLIALVVAGITLLVGYNINSKVKEEKTILDKQKKKKKNS